MNNFQRTATQGFDYNLGTVDALLGGLDILRQKQNIEFNNTIDEKVSETATKSREEYSSAMANNFASNYLSYLSEEDQSFYKSNQDSWTTQQTLDFWATRQDYMAQSLEQNGGDSDSFASSLTNWNNSWQTQVKQEELQTQLSSAQSRIQELNTQIAGLDKTADNYDYNLYSLSQELSYQQEQVKTCHDQLQNNVVRYSFDTVQELRDFQQMLTENNINSSYVQNQTSNAVLGALGSTAVGFGGGVSAIAQYLTNEEMTGKELGQKFSEVGQSVKDFDVSSVQCINGQYVLMVDRGNADAALEIAKQNNVDIDFYQEKFVSSRYTTDNNGNETRDENGNIVFNDKSENHRSGSYGGDLMYSGLINPVINMGMTEIAQTEHFVSRVEGFFSAGLEFDKHDGMYHERQTCFGHCSTRDISYEMDFTQMVNNDRRMAYIEDKYHISRYDLTEWGADEDRISAEDLVATGKNGFEKSELKGFVKDVELQEFMDDKYGLKVPSKAEWDKMSVAQQNDLKHQYALKMNDANAKLLDKLQGKLVDKNGNSLIARNGRLDLERLKRSGLTAEKLGISEKEFKLLKECAASDPSAFTQITQSGTALLGMIMEKASRYGEGQDFSWFYDIQANVNRFTKIKKGVTNVTKYVREMDFGGFKARLSSIKKRTVKKKAKKDAIKKAEQGLSKKADTIVKSKSKVIESARKKEASRLVAKQRFEKSFVGKAVKKVNAAKMQFLNNTWAGKAMVWMKQALAHAGKFAFSYIAVPLFWVWVVLSAMMAVVLIFFALVPGLLEEPETEDTAYYKLYEHGMDLQDEWTKALRDEDSWWTNRKKIAYGPNYTFYDTLNGQTAFERYINAEERGVKNASCKNANKVLINPFKFEPKDDDVLHEVDSYDGGVEIEIVSNFNIQYSNENGKIVLGENHWQNGGGHTCNIKDIICMIDVMMGFDASEASWDKQSLSDSTAQLTFKDACKKTIHAGKSIGLGIMSIFSDDAFAKWDKEMEDGSGTVSWLSLRSYMDGLFNMSHQEKVNLKVITFPIYTSVDPNAVDMKSEGDGMNDAFVGVIDKCPGGKFHLDADKNGGVEVNACCKYDDFKPFYYDQNKSGIAITIPVQAKIGLEGEDGLMHVVDNEVFWNGESPCIPNNLGSNSKTKAEYVQIFNLGCTSDHWKKGKEETDKEVKYSDEKEKGDLSKFQQEVVDGDSHESYSETRNLMSNSPEQSYSLTKTWYTSTSKTKQKKVGTKTVKYTEWCGGFDCEEVIAGGQVVGRTCPGHEKEREEDVYKDVTVYEITKHTQTVEWSLKDTCKGHTGYYCGGHLKCLVSGVVYSFKENDIRFVNDELEDDNYELHPPITDGSVNTSTLQKAALTGLNLHTEASILEVDYHEVFGDVWCLTTEYPEKRALLQAMMGWQDIFDVDHSIKYGRYNFPYNNWRNYEGWTSENMTLAMLKYGQDWNEIYGFDIPVNIGFGTMQSADIVALNKALADKYGDNYGEVRQYVVGLALKAVGNGTYSSNAHHWHAYTCTKHGELTCTATDCSGFASYPLIQTERDKNIKLNKPKETNGLAFSCCELAGVGTNGGKYHFGTQVVRGDFSNCKPGDIISYIVSTDASENSNGSNHSVVFIGVLDEDLELPSGTIIRKGNAMIVDCTTLGENGGIYFRNYAKSGQDGCKCQEWGTLYNWKSKYNSGDTKMYVRNILAGTQLQ